VACLPLGAVLPAARPAHGEPPPGEARFILLDQRLVSSRVDLLGVAGGALRVVDAQRAERDVRLDEAVALVPGWWVEGPALATAAAIPAASPASTAPADSPGRSDAGTIVGVVTLVDGQRLPGSPGAPDGGAVTTAPPFPRTADTLAWSHPRFGRLRVPLDRVRSITLTMAADLVPAPGAAAAAGQPSTDPDDPWPAERGPAARPVPPHAVVPSSPEPLTVSPAPGGGAGNGAGGLGGVGGVPIDDLVVLRNGDRLRGLVEEVGDTVAVAAPGAAGATTRVAIDRVREIVLANRPVAPAGTYAWIDGGTIVRLERIESAVEGGAGAATDVIAGVLASELGAPGRAVWRVGETAALLFDAAAARPLSSLPLKRQSPPAGRRRFEPAVAAGDPSGPLWCRDVLIRGPMTLEWELPPGSTRISGTIEMPEAAWAWGDCRVEAWLVSNAAPDAVAPSRPANGADKGSPPAVLAAERLNASRPRVPLAAEFPPTAAGARLRVTVDEGENGPIQDWVDLRRVLVGTRPR
jgi:hypothetical protein